MPELPDVETYLACLRPRIVGCPLLSIRLSSPFLLRTAQPPLDRCFARPVGGLRRIGKRIVIELEGSLFLVIHLMIAGRFRWLEPGAAIPGRLGLAAFDFESGALILTEAGSRKRASLHVVEGEEDLARLDPGGIEVLQCGFDRFRQALACQRHTLKRSLTDPRILAGIGNAYSDEILHHARLSPFKLAHQLSQEELRRLYDSACEVLSRWTQQLKLEAGEGFPKKVTAFRKGMAVHGRHRKPCPDCGSPIQRIVYASKEANYCAPCQTNGKLLADRALSRLLREDWPKTLEELEQRYSSKSRP